jgi:molybdopterin molybdotransferase
MISVDEALRRIEANTAPLGVETVGLAEALGRVLAADVLADRDFPPTDRSAMDGFAVRSADLGPGGGALRVVRELRTGRSAEDVTLEQGTAVRIFTGAVVPDGADAVVMVEETEEDRSAGTVAIRSGVEPGQNVRPQAQDLRRGDAVLAAGAPIRAAEIAALASVGARQFAVHRDPRVHVLSTGDEVVEPEQQPLPHQVRNSNGRTLMAQLAEVGLAGSYLGIAGDEGKELRRKLDEGLDGDVLLISGGVSVGEYDLVGQTLERAGMELFFHRVAVKPGKPILAGRCGDCLVIGLPGNPVSVFCGFAVFVAPALRRLRGIDRWQSGYSRARLGSRVRNRPGRRTYQLASLEWGTEGPSPAPTASSSSPKLPRNSPPAPPSTSYPGLERGQVYSLQYRIRARRKQPAAILQTVDLTPVRRPASGGRFEGERAALGRLKQS